MSNRISMTISVDPEEASYIAALVELFDADNGSIESCFTVRMLPELLYRIVCILREDGFDDKRYFDDVASGMHWDETYKARIAALLTMPQ